MPFSMVEVASIVKQDFAVVFYELCMSQLFGAKNNQNYGDSHILN